MSGAVSTTESVGWAKGWPLVCLTLAACAVLAATRLGGDEQSVRSLIRITARVGVLMFALTYAASSLARLWPSPGMRWLLQHRRYLGVSFAVLHFTHLAGIITFGVRFPDAYQSDVDTLTRVAGGLGYLLLAAMVATSFDGAQRALGRNWQRLHTTGIHYVWLVFTFNYTLLTVDDLVYLPFALALWSALGARVTAGRRR